MTVVDLSGAWRAEDAFGVCSASGSFSMDDLGNAVSWNWCGDDGLCFSTPILFFLLTFVKVCEVEAASKDETSNIVGVFLISCVVKPLPLSSSSDWQSLLLFLLPLVLFKEDVFLAIWFTHGLPMALTTFLLEPLFHADVMLVIVLLLGLIFDTRAGKSSSWKAVFFAVAVYVKDIPEEIVGAAEDDKLGKSSSLSLTAASWAELWERTSTHSYSSRAEAAGLHQAEQAAYLTAVFLKLIT